MTHGINDDMDYDPFNVEFTKWLALKFYNHKTMNHYTKNALWIYWARGDDEVELVDEESLDSDDEDEVTEIFRIGTNVFDFETPMCRAFKEFNYLLQIDLDVPTKNITGFKLPKIIRMTRFMNGIKISHGCIKDHGGIMEHENLENTNRDHEEREYEMKHNDEERCELLDDQERPVCNIRRFEMIKYSFRDDEDYVAVKENEYDDLTSTSKEAIHAYQEVFRMMNEGWMVTHTE
nr:SGNH hydrolase-type esterase domain-containing protein [Tanacetum cinerariifolium]